MNSFVFEYMLKCNLFLWSKLNFQHHYSSLQCHMILQTVVLLHFFVILWKPRYSMKKEQHLFEIDIFYKCLMSHLSNLMHLSSNRIINFLKKKKLQSPNVCSKKLLKRSVSCTDSTAINLCIFTPLVIRTKNRFYFYWTIQNQQITQLSRIMTLHL